MMRLGRMTGARRSANHASHPSVMVGVLVPERQPDCNARLVSQALTPKYTLSFETGSVTEWFPGLAPYFDASVENCQSEAAVSRQTI